MGSRPSEPSIASPWTSRESCSLTCSPTGACGRRRLSHTTTAGRWRCEPICCTTPPYASLALVDVVALAPWGSDFFRLVGEHVDVFSALPAAVHEGALRAYVAGASQVGIAPAAMEALVSPWLGTHGQAAFYRQIAQADQAYTDEIEHRYPELDLPVLVIWGRDDSWIPVDRSHRLAALIPGAQLRLVEGAGHLIQLDQPTALATTLTRWLDAKR